ncbi:glucosaminidase domain-containing protein [Thiomicrospira sp. ALE5]|uniref:glucosaminidase domain-containing protein n=1 Tax=Thiomicrospira sp. ALE5 TaxID=748650 RepID=UPI0008E68AAB|nr:glucosaminidase domain-containing protein [Thiomicrospira sp. ALE5]SFR54495.1 Bax protein [Thiomicrospira sp. ALE5]
MLTYIKFSLIPLTIFAGWIFYERGQSLDKKDKPFVAVELPDFAAIVDVNEKKQAFVDFLLPAIEASNQAIKQERQFLMQLNVEQMSNQQRTKLEALAEKYQQPRNEGQSLAEWQSALIKKVDIIPPALALAQAANESAWGTSRFAIDGMNFFGQWCFSVGCGLVPNQRPEGQTYEVRVFDSPQASVDAYMLNLNAFHTYEDLRDIRAEKRANNQPLNSEALAEGLLAYSTKREVYIEELQAMIRFNQWQGYDKKL